MNIAEALRELERCDWLKITGNHVSASRWKTRAQMSMMTRDEYERDPHAFRECSVSTRRKKSESFEELLIRAATLVRAGHKPTIRVPPQTNKDRCACGADNKGHGLEWNQQLQQRMCRKCSIAWANAAMHNDMMPASNGEEH